LDNFGNAIVECDKNVAGKRISRVIKSLNHDHVRDKPFAESMRTEWHSWIKTLYEGYRHDSIHLYPENCKA